MRIYRIYNEKTHLICYISGEHVGEAIAIAVHLKVPYEAIRVSELFIDNIQAFNESEWSQHMGYSDWTNDYGWDFDSDCLIHRDYTPYYTRQEKIDKFLT